MFPHSITVLNKVKSSGSVVYISTIIKGVLFTTNTINSNSLESSDPSSKISVVIPFNAECSKQFIDKLGYVALDDEEKVNYWTLSKDDIILKGEQSVVNPTAQTINDTYTEKLTISSVLTYDYGTLKHWEVGGN